MTQNGRYTHEQISEQLELLRGKSAAFDNDTVQAFRMLKWASNELRIAQAKRNTPSALLMKQLLERARVLAADCNVAASRAISACNKASECLEALVDMERTMLKLAELEVKAREQDTHDG